MPLALSAAVCHTATMPKPIKHKKRPNDVNEWAHSIVNESTMSGLPTEAQVSQLMAAMGRKGGKIGGKRRLETMNPKERSAVARKAARARWQKKRSNS